MIHLTARAAVAVAIVLVAWCGAANAQTDPCAGKVDVIVVLGRSHRLLLCGSGKVDGEFKVSLGRGGLGKRVVGDNRTPIGVFSLGPPRLSEKFGTFIPVGYPNAEQRRLGFAGGDIGIHGPKKKWGWLGRAANLVDWTRGCIAVNREADIAAVSQWVRSHGAGKVEIVEE